MTLVPVVGDIVDVWDRRDMFLMERGVVVTGFQGDAVVLSCGYAVAARCLSRHNPPIQRKDLTAMERTRFRAWLIEDKKGGMSDAYDIILKRLDEIDNMEESYDRHQKGM